MDSIQGVGYPGDVGYTHPQPPPSEGTWDQRYPTPWKGYGTRDIPLSGRDMGPEILYPLWTYKHLLKALPSLADGNELFHCSQNSERNFIFMQGNHASNFTNWKKR